MRRSIFAKIFGGYVLVTVILSGLILAFSFAGIRDFYVDGETESLKNLGTALDTSAIPLVAAGNHLELDRLVKKVGKETHTRITVVAPDGRVLADSETNPENMENHRTRTEVAQALDGNTGRFLRLSGTLKEEMLYIALPMKHEGRIIGVLRLSLFLKQMNDAMNRFRVKIAEITVTILGFSLLIALAFSRSLSRPIKELSAASRKVAGQDFNVRVFLRNHDELKELADSFNSMVSHTRSLFAELTHQKEELTSIISSLQEGLLVLDRNDKLLLSNESFKRLTSGLASEGDFYWEIFREPQFDELIRKVRSSRQNREDEIEFSKRIFLCSATFLESEGEVAVVFHDITQIKNLEQIKTDFVLNVSHELRTPLTAIKGFAETLEEVVEDDEARHYVDIISRNADRLMNIITDLLTLSSLEAKGAQPQFTEVNLKDLAENVLKIFTHPVKEKNLRMTLMADDALPTIEADPFKLEQMFINLVDNAVKYSEQGGIEITLKQAKEGIVIAVKDTGIGIPHDSLARIFERFYVVDKSRSKRMGGTGLGLSIVKHVVMLHHGSIEVDSSVGLGTTFTVTLPEHGSGQSS